MDNSIYVALSRQLAVMRKMDVTANNIANADTVGYHAEKMVFTDYLVGDGNRNKIAFAQDISSYRVLKNGGMRVTGNQFDVAIEGPGFMRVETEVGERYTRAGNFKRMPDGTMTTIDGHPVIGQNGQITIPQEITEITIGENGLVLGTLPGQPVPAELGTISIVEFADPQELVRTSGQLYKSDQEPQEAIESRMLHGTLETSNVSPVAELVETTKLSRATSSTAKFIEVMYDLQRKTSNAYARQSPK